MATTLRELVNEFFENERPAGNLLPVEGVLAQAIAATRFFCGYAGLEAYNYKAMPFDEITDETELNPSEWMLIRPLFLLYVERENALQLEASRGMGIDPFGRSTSEIAGEIAQYEERLGQRAFFQPVLIAID